MDVVVPTLAKFFRKSDGRIYPHRETVDTEFWKRYLKTFDQVIVVARVYEADSTNQESWIDSPITHSDIKFEPVPIFNGPISFIKSLKDIINTTKNIYKQNQAYVLRVPDPLVTVFAFQLWRKNHPFAVEVTGDAQNTFSKGAYEHPLRPLIERILTFSQKKICGNSAAISYVTEQSLQKKYPPSRDAFQTHYSSIDLTDEDIAKYSKQYSEPLTAPKIITVGGLDQLIKGPDILINTVNILNKNDISANMLWLGGGKYKEKMIKKSESMGLSQQVQFLGRVDKEEVKTKLDQADLFVLPSRQEGLPRAMIEAMARGLPCVGTTVGGIPELIPPHCLAEPNNETELARVIYLLIRDPGKMNRQSKNNLEKSKKYHYNQLQPRRDSLYAHIKNETRSG